MLTTIVLMLNNGSEKGHIAKEMAEDYQKLHRYTIGKVCFCDFS